LTEVDPFTRSGCASCDDALGNSADIAVGSIGAVPEHAAVITRTTVGDVFVENARRFGLLETVGEVDKDALDAAQAAKNRRTRGQAFDDFRILMLDALGDPGKRARVNKLFAGLYGVAQPAPIKKEVGNVTCGGC
jgi:hypothetical protein